MNKFYDTLTNTRGDVLPNYRAQVVNPNGTLVDIFADRSGTPFTDANGGTVNYATSDSEGLVEFYWEAATGQIFQMLDPAGDLVKVVEGFADNYVIGNFSGDLPIERVVDLGDELLALNDGLLERPTTAALASTDPGKGAGMVADKLDAPGAVPLTQAQINRETVTASKFGALGDGVADDAAAIQAGLDYLGANGGGTLILPVPSVHYRITAGLKLPNEVTIQGGAAFQYPFNAGNSGAVAIVADFSAPDQWIIEPKTTVGGSPVAFNAMVSGTLPAGATYNCAVRNVIVTSTYGLPGGGVLPYGAIRMHGCPGSRVEGVSVYNVGCGLLVNFCTGGVYDVHGLTMYYGVVAWDDVNANSFRVYVRQQDPLPTTVPADYLMPFMPAYSGNLVSTYRLSTNAHYNRPWGLIAGSSGSTSTTNTFEYTGERFPGVFMLNAYGATFTRLYLERASGNTDFGIVGANATFNIEGLHADLDGSGTLFDLGEVRAKVFPSGLVVVGAFGTGPYTGNANSILALEGIAPSSLKPATPQFNIVYPHTAYDWQQPTLAADWADTGGLMRPFGVRLNSRTGNVEVRGSLTKSAGAADLVFTLDPGLRPSARVHIKREDAEFVIDPNGEVRVYPLGALPAAVMADGIFWEAEQ